MPKAKAEADPLKEVLGTFAPPNRRSLGEDVTERLRAAIVRGTFGPEQHLSEATLAETFGVSRGPIREAFVELEREGLIKIERHRGARVTRLSQADIDEIYELRTALERLAIDRALRLATNDDLAALDAAVDRLQRAVAAQDVHEIVALDVGFHDAVYRAAHHDRLYQAWSALRPQIETFLHSRALDTRDYLERAVTEHAALRDAVRARSKRAALALIGEHLRSAHDRLSKLSS